MQFKVDSSGAWLNNSTFVLQKDNGGKLIIDPAYGILAGTGSLFTTSGTTVTPSFVDDDGDLILDDDGIPENANFFIDLRDGNAYFRGRVTATSGKIGGIHIYMAAAVPPMLPFMVLVLGQTVLMPFGLAVPTPQVHRFM